MSTVRVRTEHLASTREMSRLIHRSRWGLMALARAGRIPPPIRPAGPTGKCLWRVDAVLGALGIAIVEEAAHDQP